MDKTEVLLNRLPPHIRKGMATYFLSIEPREVGWAVRYRGLKGAAAEGLTVAEAATAMLRWLAEMGLDTKRQ